MRSASGGAAAPLWSEAYRSRHHHEFAKHLPAFETRQGLRGLLERESVVDDRLQASGLHHIEQRRDVAACPTIRTQDLQLERPDKADVFRRVVAGGGTAGQHAATNPQYPQAPRPGVPASVVDHDVHALIRALAAPRRLAVKPINLLYEILVGVVDDVIGAKCPEALGLVLRARGGDDDGAGDFRELHAANPDSAGGAEDQYLLIGRNMAVGVHHAARRTVGAGQTRGLLVTDRSWNADKLMSAQPAIFGEPAMYRLARQSALDSVYRITEDTVADAPT